MLLLAIPVLSISQPKVEKKTKDSKLIKVEGGVLILEHHVDSDDWEPIDFTIYISFKESTIIVEYANETQRGIFESFTQSEGIAGDLVYQTLTFKVKDDTYQLTYDYYNPITKELDDELSTFRAIDGDYILVGLIK